jgi:D-alanyl-D-alanine dipeptidase
MRLFSHKTLAAAVLCLLSHGLGYAQATTPVTQVPSPAVITEPAWLKDLISKLPQPSHWFTPSLSANPPAAAEAPAIIQPLAGMRGSCSVDDLPAITDAGAEGFENGTEDSVDTKGLTPVTANALAKFEQLISAVGGMLHVRSAYRPPAYQAHLQQVWDKWMHELRNNRTPACQEFRAAVHAEFERHRLLESQRPVNSSDHTRGMAFDAAVVLPARSAASRHSRKRPVVNLDRLALLAGLKRPDIRHDPVHFRLVARG